MIRRHSASGPLMRLEETMRTGTARVVCKSNRRLAYIGWTGHGNLGDDAMAQAMELLLPDEDLLLYDGQKRERILAAVGLSGHAYFRAALLGGGTLISPQVFGDLVDSALDQRLPTWAFGAGAGSSGFEMPNQVDLSSWAPRLARFARIGVRGYRTQSTLKMLGIPDVEVVGDLALALARPASPAAGRKFALNLALEHGTSYSAAKYASLEALETVVTGLVREGWEVVPIAMTGTDAQTLVDFLTEIGLPGTPISQPATSEAFFEMVAPCDFTVAVRLHAAVLSCCAGVPPLLFGYRDKCLDFMETMDLERWHIPLESATTSQTMAAIELLVAEAHSMRPVVTATACRWRAVLAAFADELRVSLI